MNYVYDSDGRASGYMLGDVFIAFTATLPACVELE
jgi:hypothetical protein